MFFILFFLNHKSTQKEGILNHKRQNQLKVESDALNGVEVSKGADTDIASQVRKLTLLAFEPQKTKSVKS